MSKAKCVFNLPIEIIQHIQSFLSPKESTQTCVLAKLWFKAWATRPILCLHQQYFRDGDAVSDEFWNFSRKALQRYKDLNRKLDKLLLHIDTSLPSTAIPFVDEFITDALNLGIDVLRLELCPDHDYVLPAQVFGSTSLTELYASFCVINHQMIDGRPLCSRLKSLILNFIRISDQSVRDILLVCPFIENLELGVCEGLTTVNVSKMRKKLVKLCVVAAAYNDSVRVEFNNEDFNEGLATYGGGRRREFLKFRFLLRLELLHVVLDNEFFRDFSSRFPCIEYLSLGRLPGCVDIQISSHSLRYLKLAGDEIEKMRLNVPNISQFVFEAGFRIPLLSLGTAMPRNWKSHVRMIFAREVIEDSWFVEFRKFLTVLSPSRISLHIFGLVDCTLSAERIPCFPTPGVEDLLVFGHPSWNMSPSLLRGLFWCCRPSFISSFASENCVPQLIYEQLIRNENKDLYCMYNLEKVNLELFEDNLKEWQTISAEKLRNSPEIPHNGKHIRFQLLWGPGGLTG